MIECTVLDNVSGLTKRYRANDSAVCDCCTEKAAAWYDCPIENELKFYMCWSCMAEHYMTGAIEFHTDRDLTVSNELQNDMQDGVTALFTIGSFTIKEFNQMEWGLIKEVCEHCDCGTEFVYFQNLKEVIQEAQRLTDRGHKPKVGETCPSCSYDISMEEIRVEIEQKEQLRTLEAINQGEVTNRFDIGEFQIVERTGVFGKKWEFGTGICSLNLCTTDFKEFTDRQAAIEVAKQLTEEGVSPELTTPCSICFAEHYGV